MSILTGQLPPGLPDEVVLEKLAQKGKAEAALLSLIFRDLDHIDPDLLSLLKCFRQGRHWCERLIAAPNVCEQAKARLGLNVTFLRATVRSAMKGGLGITAESSDSVCIEPNAEWRALLERLDSKIVLTREGLDFVSGGRGALAMSRARGISASEFFVKGLLLFVEMELGALGAVLAVKETVPLELSGLGAVESFDEGEESVRKLLGYDLFKASFSERSRISEILLSAGYKLSSVMEADAYLGGLFAAANKAARQRVAEERCRLKMEDLWVWGVKDMEELWLDTGVGADKTVILGVGYKVGHKGVTDSIDYCVPYMRHRDDIRMYQNFFTACSKGTVGVSEGVLWGRLLFSPEFARFSDYFINVAGFRDCGIGLIESKGLKEDFRLETPEYLLSRSLLELEEVPKEDFPKIEFFEAPLYKSLKYKYIKVFCEIDDPDDKFRDMLEEVPFYGGAVEGCADSAFLKRRLLLFLAEDFKKTSFLSGWLPEVAREERKRFGNFEDMVRERAESLRLRDW